MGKLYNEEKVLYFANQAQGLHVSDREASDTDLSNIVRHLLGNRLIEKVAADDSGDYFKTTLAGERRLLELQIKWRTSRNKDVTEHRARLAELED
ncbi:hypothetical protein [Halomonas salipaludis]|uniref:Uncharacterized protein n=1 Tax=Halomonas salipaludis TaxID=2032625 RepID=A0A2A2F3K7_9GAMM|nr:hypothetical protein [Halomonas salipaludis]PAU79192.1 hypothetical protein CK498_02150 [Halomonas salipaludis]